MRILASIEKCKIILGNNSNTLYLLFLCIFCVICGCSDGKLSQDVEVDEKYIRLLMDKYKKYPNSIDYDFNEKGQLYRLSINNIPLKKYPEEIDDFLNLEVLRFRNTKITQLPELSSLKKLKTLMLIDCEIKGVVNLPLTYSKLSVLTLFSFKAEVTNIYFPKGCKLEELWLSGNKLEVINDSFLYLKNLKILDLSGNPIGNKSLFNMTNIASLEKLYLNNCSIRKLPSQITNLGNLRNLSLFENPITKRDLNELRVNLPKCEIIP